MKLVLFISCSTRSARSTCANYLEAYIHKANRMIECAVSVSARLTMGLRATKERTTQVSVSLKTKVFFVSNCLELSRLVWMNLFFTRLFVFFVHASVRYIRARFSPACNLPPTPEIPIFSSILFICQEFRAIARPTAISSHPLHKFTNINPSGPVGVKTVFPSCPKR